MKLTDIIGFGMKRVENGFGMKMLSHLHQSIPQDRTSLAHSIALAHQVNKITVRPVVSRVLVIPAHQRNSSAIGRFTRIQRILERVSHMIHPVKFLTHQHVVGEVRSAKLVHIAPPAYIN